MPKYEIDIVIREHGHDGTGSSDKEHAAVKVATNFEAPAGFAGKYGGDKRVIDNANQLLDAAAAIARGE